MARIAGEVQQEIAHFKPHVPLLLTFCKKGFKDNHWKMLSERLGTEVKQSLIPSLQHMLDLGLDAHVQQCTEVGYYVDKEYQLEQNLLHLENKWDEEKFVLAPYK